MFEGLSLDNLQESSFLKSEGLRTTQLSQTAIVAADSCRQLPFNRLKPSGACKGTHTLAEGSQYCMDPSSMVSAPSPHFLLIPSSWTSLCYFHYF